jgi:hypothetical protein
LQTSNEEKVYADLAAKTVKIGLQDEKPQISVLVGQTVEGIQKTIEAVLGSR